MVLVVTRNVPDRYRGFLASCMLEVAPGIYTSPDMTLAVRERVWAVCTEWAAILPDNAGVLMAWRDKHQPSGQAIRSLGWPRKELVEHDGIWLDRSQREQEPA